MKLFLHSEQASAQQGIGWTRSGDNIQYYSNGIPRDGTFPIFYHTLSFEHIFQHSGDTVYFAYSIPYTYTKLQRFLDELERDPDKSKVTSRRTLCRTLGGNNCDYLIITNTGTNEENKEKRGAVISARAHPGETVGSWMMEGVIDFLTGPTKEANALRKKYIFTVLPMINPDGVINGNYRCSLAGCDLNRRWNSPSPALHPVVFRFKRAVKSLLADREIDLICDLHGHSRRKDVFMYGCNTPGSPEVCRLFPFVFSRISPMFSYESCRFGVQKSRERTLRVNLFRELGVSNVFTLEASFCGARSGGHFTTEVFKGIGRDLCRTLLVYSSPSVEMTKCRAKKRTGKKLVESLAEELINSEKDLQSGNADSSSSGSEPEPSEDNLDEVEIEKVLTFTHKNTKRDSSWKNQIKISNANQKKENSQGGNKRELRKIKEFQGKIGRKSLLKQVGLRTSYNRVGKKMHDQQTQTPVEFYPDIIQFRAGNAEHNKWVKSLNRARLFEHRVSRSIRNSTELYMQRRIERVIGSSKIRYSFFEKRKSLVPTVLSMAPKSSQKMGFNFR